MRKNGFVRLAAASVMAVAGMACPVTAQDSPQQAASQPTPTASGRSPIAHAGPLVDIDFQGGTLSAFVEVIRAALDDQQPGVNFMLRQGAGEIPIPAVTLRRVSPESALRAACPAEFARVSTIEGGGSDIIVVDLLGGNALGELDRRQSQVEQRRQQGLERTSGPTPGMSLPGGSRATEASAESLIQIYSVKDIVTGGTQLGAVMDAVKTTLAVQREEPQPELLYHEESGVLIVRGSRSQHIVVHELLATLRDDSRSRQAEASEALKRAAMAQDRTREVQTRVETMQLDLDLQRAKLARLQKLVEEGLATEDDINAASVEVRKSELVLKQMQSELSAARQVAEQLQRLENIGAPTASRSEGYNAIKVEKQEIARKLLTVIAELTKMGGSTQITGVDVKDGKLIVRYAGTAEGVDHLRALCNLVEQLDHAD